MRLGLGLGSRLGKIGIDLGLRLVKIVVRFRVSQTGVRL